MSLLLMTLNAVLAQENLFNNGKKAPAEEAVSQDEMILYNMINDFRKQNKLPLIPLSPALCSVSQIHIDDILSSQPQKKGCSLHSWSESANWSGCCHNQDLAGMQCMKLKPKEIAGYQGFGYELIYWGEEKATPSDAFEMWQQTNASADMILGHGKWKGYQWKALGVGMKDGYAMLWLGDKPDKILTTIVPPVEPLSQKSIEKEAGKQQIEKKGKAARKADTTLRKNESANNHSDPVKPGAENKPRYYLVVASVKEAVFTKDELRRFKAKGFPDAVILNSGTMFRIALMSYETEQKAKIKLDELKGNFPDIWIYRK